MTRQCVVHIAKELPMTPLRQRMIEDMQIRNLSPHTQDSYVQQISQFARYFGKSPAELLPEDIRTYQIYLTNEKKLASSSILIAVSAIRFLFKVTLKREWNIEEVVPTCKKPQKLPTILSPEEVLQFLDCVPGIKHTTILTTCYAAGLRISEAVRLKPHAIDSKRMVIRVEQGGECQCSCRLDYVMIPSIDETAALAAAGSGRRLRRTESMAPVATAAR